MDLCKKKEEAGIEGPAPLIFLNKEDSPDNCLAVMV